MDLNFQIEYLNSIGSGANMDNIAALTNPVALKEYMDRFDLDKYYLRAYLNRKKEIIDLVLKQLDAMD